MSLADRAMAHQNPKDAIEHATVICTPNAARLVRQHRLDGGPFIIAGFVAHDSRLRFRSLNHVSGSAINPQAYGVAANALNLLPLSAGGGFTVHPPALALKVAPRGLVG